MKEGKVGFLISKFLGWSLLWTTIVVHDTCIVTICDPPNKSQRSSHLVKKYYFEIFSFKNLTSACYCACVLSGVIYWFLLKLTFFVTGGWISWYFCCPFLLLILYIGKLWQRKSLTNLTNLDQIVKPKPSNIKLRYISNISTDSIFL